jgi:type 1 glutamine amidotransferase
MKRQGKTLGGLKACIMGLAVVLIASGSQAFQLSKVLCVDMCGSNGSGGACHPGQQVTADAMMQDIATQCGFTLEITKDATPLTASNLKNYDVVVFNNVGNNPFNATQQAAFQSYMYNGGGYVGWHASDANHYTWPWYVDTFMCADINGHGGVTPLPISLDNLTNPCISGVFCNNIIPKRTLQDTTMADEWYYWKPDPTKNLNVKVLGWVLENGVKRPMMWCQEFKKSTIPGRMWYSNCGQSNSGSNNFYTNSWFKQSVINGLRWAAKLDLACTDVKPGQSPSRNTARQTLESLMEKGHTLVTIYGIDGRKLSTHTFASYKELLGAMPAGCHIVKVMDESRRIVQQMTVAK